MTPTPNPRLTQLLTTLRQPQWIAALVSVAFHGVLFAAGPSFTGLTMAALEGNDPSDERRVPLIELTPEEQGRLPDFSASAYSPFPGGEDDLFSLFPPSGDSLPLDPLPDFGADRGSGFGSSLALPPLSNRPFSPLSPFPGSASIVVPPRRSTPPPIPNGSALRRPANPSSPAESMPTAPTEGANGANGADGDTAAAPRSGETPVAPEASAPLTPDAQAAARASDLLARVEHDGQGTSEAEIEIAKAAWVRAVKAKLGDDVAAAPDPIALTVPYTGRLCLEPPPNDGLVGLVGLPAESGNELELWTTVLKSTGYPFLNQAAEQALQGLAQPSGEDEGLEANTLYQVVVKIDYNSQSCLTREALLQSRTADPDDSPENGVPENGVPENGAENGPGNGPSRPE